METQDQHDAAKLEPLRQAIREGLEKAASRRRGMPRRSSGKADRDEPPVIWARKFPPKKAADLQPDSCSPRHFV